MNVTTGTSRPNGMIFLLLFAVQIVGVALVIWNGLPIFRQLAANPGEQVQDGLLGKLIMFAGVLVMQGAYWYRFLSVRIPVRNPNVILNHIFIFSGRLGFIFGSSLFSTVFFRHLPELREGANVALIISNGVLLFASLFSLFCFTLELERVGRSFDAGPRA
jgi:hypothetical protein